MSIRPARIRTIVAALGVLAFIIPWTYAHIAYAWPWKRFQKGHPHLLPGPIPGRRGT